MANPTSIMGAAALSWIDVDQGGMFQDTAGTTAAGVGDLVAFVPDGVGGAAYTQGTSGSRPTLRDGYLEFRNDIIEKAVSVSGGVWIGIRFRRDGLPDANTRSVAGLDAGTGTDAWFDSANIHYTFRAGTNDFYTFSGTAQFAGGDSPGSAIPDLTFTSIHAFADATDRGHYVNGVVGDRVSASDGAPTLSRAMIGGMYGSGDDFKGPYDIVRFYVLDAEPDSTQLAALTDWLENGDVGGAPEITGALTAQETGSDAASASVEVVLLGTVAAQDSGGDSAAASVTVGVAAALAGQEAGFDLATATGAVGLEAALVAQEVGADSASASVAVGIAGALGTQEAGADSAAASASVAMGITISAQETGPDLASASAAVTVSSALGAQEAGQDSAAGSTTVAVAGAVAAQEAGSDAAAVSAGVAVAGALEAQESGADRAVIQAGSGRIVTLSAQEAGSDQAAGSAAVGIDAGLGAQEFGGDIASVIISIADNVITVNLAARETGPDVASGAAAVGVAAAALAREQGADGAVILGNVVILASAALSETGADRVTIVVQNAVPIPSARRAATPAQSANGGSLTVTGNGGRLIQSRNGGRLV